MDKPPDKFGTTVPLTPQPSEPDTIQNGPPVRFGTTQPLSPSAPTPFVEWEPTAAGPAAHASERAPQRQPSQPQWSPPSGNYRPAQAYGSGTHDLQSAPSAISHAGSGSSSMVHDAPASMPLPYIVASAVFLAIAVVGFGLWLAFEVF